MTEFLRIHNVTTIEHPPQSPDLNPIENIWHLGTRKLDSYLLHNYINSKQELFNKIQEFISSIPVEMVNKLIDTMPARVAEVRIQDGRNTRY